MKVKGEEHFVGMTERRILTGMFIITNNLNVIWIGRTLND